MTPTISPLCAADLEAVGALFNYYVEHSFAAYPEQRLPHQAFQFFLDAAKTHPVLTVKDETGRLLGFGMLTPFDPFSSFRKTVEVASFLDPERTGLGLGTLLLEALEARAREMGIKTILANISSLNPRSIQFHAKHGYVECGRFLKVGHKLGHDFDMVYMQKFL